MISDANTFFEHTAGKVIFNTKLGALGWITGHNTNYHYQTKQQMLSDKYSKNIFEWHPIDHIPLLKDGIVSVAKKETGYVPYADCIFIIPTYVIFNYQYEKLTHQYIFKDEKFHMQLFKHLFDYIDKHRLQISHLENQISALTQTLKVCVINNVYLNVVALDFCFIILLFDNT